MTTIIKNKYYLDIPNYPHEIAKFHRTISFHDLSSISITTNTHVPVNYIAFVNDRKFFPIEDLAPKCRAKIHMPFNSTGHYFRLISFRAQDHVLTNYHV